MLWSLFWSFVKIGAFTFGGGYAMITLIEDEVVKRRGWIEGAEFVDMVVLAQTAPGILAMNISILVGRRVAGNGGAAVAALGAGLPSFVIILVIAMFLGRFQDNAYVMRAFRALRPAVVALIAVPVFNMAKSAGITLHTAWITVTTAVLIWLVGLSPVWVILAAFAGGAAVKVVRDKRRK